MLRALLFGVFLAGAGCPHPMPGPVGPAPASDGGADAPVGCNVPRATQDKLTTAVVNACAAKGQVGAAAGPDLATARCVMEDIVMDVREAPKLEACVRTWLVVHGGAL